MIALADVAEPLLRDEGEPLALDALTPLFPVALAPWAIDVNGANPRAVSDQRGRGGVLRAPPSAVQAWREDGRPPMDTVFPLDSQQGDGQQGGVMGASAPSWRRPGSSNG
jgi:hypothetical protein